jgi:hypothetical protein
MEPCSLSLKGNKRTFVYVDRETSLNIVQVLYIGKLFSTTNSTK